MDAQGVAGGGGGCLGVGIKTLRVTAWAHLVEVSIFRHHCFTLAHRYLVLRSNLSDCSFSVLRYVPGFVFSLRGHFEIEFAALTIDSEHGTLHTDTRPHTLRARTSFVKEPRSSASSASTCRANLLRTWLAAISFVTGLSIDSTQSSCRASRVLLHRQPTPLLWGSA